MSVGPERLLVMLETAPGSGRFELDERAGVEELRDRAGLGASTARVAVRIDAAFDVGAAMERYHPDRRVLVTTDEAVATDRTVLFDGYAARQTWAWDGRLERESETYGFEAEHVLARAAAAADAFVVGQRRRSGGMGTAGDASLIPATALACVFNPDGAGNRDGQPVLRADGTLADVFGDERSGMRWNYAEVLRYLLGFHGPALATISTTALRVALDPAGLQETSGRLASRLLGEPVELRCEGKSLQEAIAVWSRASGVHVAARSHWVGEGVVTEPTLWALEDGPVAEVGLAATGVHADGTPRYVASSREAALRENQVYRGALTWSHGAGATQARVLGDAKLYEVTLPLWPGWLPRAGLDNVAPANRGAAKAAALTQGQVEAMGVSVASDAWFQSHHAQGALFAADGDAGRLWVLNEDGALGTAYERNEPFDAYAACEFEKVLGVPVASAWARRARRLLPLVSGVGAGDGGVVVEVSYDAGATWQRPSCAYRVLEDRAGIYLEAENLADVRPAGVSAELQNAWYALVDQTFRVRVTARVAGDERVEGRAVAARRRARGRRGTTVDATGVYGFTQRGALADTVAELLEAPRDDSEALTRAARAVAATIVDPAIEGTLVIPWLEAGYAVGDQVQGIAGRQIPLGDGSIAPVVVERRFVLSETARETVLVLSNQPMA